MRYLILKILLTVIALYYINRRTEAYFLEYFNKKVNEQQ